MRAFKAVTFLLGLSLLIWIIRKVGVGELLQGFQTLQWRLLVPVAIIFPCYLLYTTSWKLFLRRFEGHSIPFWTLFRIKVAGEATNTLTPLNFAGGDPVRVWLLSKNFPVAIGGASVVVDRTIQILAVVSLIFLGNLAALFRLALPLYAKNLLGITATLLLLFILLFIFQQTRGFFQKALRILTKLRIKKFSEKTRRKVEEMDHHVGEFYRRSPGLFFFCYLMHFGGRLIGILELYALAHFLGVPMGLWEAVFFAAVIPITNMLGTIVPGTLGVLEGVVSSLFFALNWDPADGVVLQIARRLRALFWISLGLLFIFLFKSKTPQEAKKAP